MFVIGNWKMNLLREEGINFVKEISDKLPPFEKVHSIICAPFIYMHCMHHHQGNNLRVGAQNMYFEESGAYTGEVSVTQLKDIGCEYVIIGHSERRQIFKEDDELINKKVSSCINHNMNPILCIGETILERENNLTKDILLKQIKEDLNNINDLSKVIIAYEPIWAIGTGLSATVEDAENTISYIKNVIEDIYKIDLPVLYGGSVKTNNFEDYIKGGIIDGALIGGASLKSENFLEFVNIALKYSK